MEKVSGKLIAPRLSILIPAFNQAAMLDATLTNLAALQRTQYVQSNKFLLEVIVSDNNSADSTRIVAERFVDFVEYFKQDENLGFLGNIDFLARKAAGEFVWFLGCGETITNPNFLEDLLTFLDKKRVLNVTIESTWAQTRPLHRTAFILADVNEPRTTLFSELISGNIFNSNAYRDVICNPLKHGSWWPHIERTLHMMQDLNNVELASYVSTNSPLAIGVSDTGWAYEKTAYLAPARELELLYSTAVSNTSLKSKRRRLGLIGIPSWIYGQKVAARFNFTWAQWRELVTVLKPVPIGIKAGIFLVFMLPSGLLRVAHTSLKYGRALRNELKVGNDNT